MVGHQIVAAYVCYECKVEGTDPELCPFTAVCWCCGEPAVVTARMAVRGEAA